MRYSGTTVKQTIQYDGDGKPLFSVDSPTVLLLMENGNGDVCVADCCGGVVVVLSHSGELRFKYDGSVSKTSQYTDFQPFFIAVDVNHCIVISDSENEVVHVIDCDGNFIRYIEYPCNGGLSIDTDHNLVLGDYVSGKVRVIKYIE
jgi:hypothetical protein